MAQKTIVQLVDDLDGGAADESVSFGLDSQQYEIDLSAANATDLRQALARYVSSGRPVARNTGRLASPAGAGKPRSRRSAEIREWARSRGIDVNARGRIPARIEAQYDQENP
ncbi:histone-like nucleoid-structuring protein Lsr2 [Nocardiopsis coralliicola]